MRRLLAFLIMAFMVGGCVGSGAENGTNDLDNQTGVVGDSKVVQESKVEIVINDGVIKSSTSADVAEGMSAFEGLQLIAEEKNIEIEFTDYDFGIMVDAIGGMSNTEEKAWIYYVNGKSGNVGADQYELQSGDLLEWKYTKPIF